MGHGIESFSTSAHPFLFQFLELRDRSRSKPTLIKKNKGSTVELQQIACGGYHTVGVNGEGHLVSWGFGQKGQLGHGIYDDSISERKIIDLTLFSKQVQRVACGMFQACVLTTDGELYSW